MTAMVSCIRSSTRVAAATTRSRRSPASSMAASNASWPPAGLIASSAAANSSVALSGKTRKIVPSAMPAASAISLVVTSPPALDQQRDQRVEDRLAAVVGCHGGGTGSHADNSN